MHIVINHIHLTMPVRNLLPSFEAEGLPLLVGLPGFRGFYCVEEAPDRAALIILWETAQAAINGAQLIGPTWFADTIEPHLASEQQRTLGEVIVEIHR